MSIKECHDCDNEAFAQSTLSLRDIAERLVTLEPEAMGGAGERGARAAFELGVALFNFTRHGNARAVLGDRHRTVDTRPAEQLLALAHGRSRDPELKGRAAWMAARAEQARLTEQRSRGRWMDYQRIIATTWFPKVEALAGSGFERELLRECGYYRSWRRHHR